MAKAFLYSVLRPGWNRYYADRKVYKLAYVLRFVPAFIGLTIMAILFPSWIYIPIVVAIIILGVLDYFVFDMISEKIWWKLVYKRFYGDQVGMSQAEFNTIRQFDKNPSNQNLNNLKKNFKE